MGPTTSTPWPGNRVSVTNLRRRAIVLPGRGYSVAYPLLYWSCQALAGAGWFVQTVSWDADEVAPGDAGEFVAGAARLASEDAPRAATTLVVGKSLGTFAAAWATERGWPGAWLTPLLELPEVTQPLRAAARDGIPGLLVGGSADPTWNGVVARGVGLPVHEAPGADHSLEVPTGWSDSVAAVVAAVAAVTAFAETV